MGRARPCSRCQHTTTGWRLPSPTGGAGCSPPGAPGPAPDRAQRAGQRPGTGHRGGGAMGRRFPAAQEDATGALVLRVRPRKRAQRPPEVAALSQRPLGAGHGFGPVAAKLHLLLAGDPPAADGLGTSSGPRSPPWPRSWSQPVAVSVTRSLGWPTVGRPDALPLSPGLTDRRTRPSHRCSVWRNGRRATMVRRRG